MTQSRRHVFQVLCFCPNIEHETGPSTLSESATQLFTPDHNISCLIEAQRTLCLVPRYSGSLTRPTPGHSRAFASDIRVAPIVNALLLELAQVDKLGRNPYLHLSDLSDRVVRADLESFGIVQRADIEVFPRPAKISAISSRHIDFLEAASKSHAACAEYLLLRRKMCREGPESVPLWRIDEALAAFSRCLRQMSGQAEEIKT
ncbi:hypothetical protein FB45DRAFT_152408 [Roridomyces roridus]|uniref:Uncharacterized protein n=1 Tax=Roridomyces roridus TaxID=1738132 RepID=A0AAD7AXE2_9AGAR|nr:hypothetical protein FB45DRAFT_152408 [Roridomyces roridus]